MVITEVRAAILTKYTMEVIKKSPKKMGINVNEICENKYCFNFN